MNKKLSGELEYYVYVIIDFKMVELFKNSKKK